MNEKNMAYPLKVALQDVKLRERSPKPADLIRKFRQPRPNNRLHVQNAADCFRVSRRQLG
jgi:hypothetical protein